MTMADADGGGQKQLLVGSDDFEVFALSNEPASIWKFAPTFSNILLVY